MKTSHLVVAAMLAASGARATEGGGRPSGDGHAVSSHDGHPASSGGRNESHDGRTDSSRDGRTDSSRNGRTDSSRDGRAGSGSSGEGHTFTIGGSNSGSSGESHAGSSGEPRSPSTQGSGAASASAVEAHVQSQLAMAHCMQAVVEAEQQQMAQARQTLQGQALGQALSSIAAQSGQRQRACMTGGSAPVTGEPVASRPPLCSTHMMCPDHAAPRGCRYLPAPVVNGCSAGCPRLSCSHETATPAAGQPSGGGSAAPDGGTEHLPTGESAGGIDGGSVVGGTGSGTEHACAPAPHCVAPPPGCSYEPATPDANGCVTSCGAVKCQAVPML